MTDSARALLGSALYVALVVLPALMYLKRRGQTDKRIVLSIFAIWLPWSAVNTPIHEGAHALAGLLVGMHIRGGQFIQHFWQGDFVHGYVLWEPASLRQFLFSTSGPYVVDALISLSAFFWLPRKRGGSFVGALLLSITYLRSVFDVTVNYTADTLFGGKGDFDFLLSGYPRLVVHAVAVLIILLSACGAAWEIVLARDLKQPHFVESKLSVV
jgi:hypothetical protein